MSKAINIFTGKPVEIERPAPHPIEEPEPLTITPEEFAAYAAHRAAREKETQNEEGVHVGDIFYSSWGYEQTNVDFYQVVELRGKHTAIISEICGKTRVTGNMSGQIRAVRDSFTKGAKRYTVRTKKSGIGVLVSIPYSSAHREPAWATDEFTEHYVSWYY